MAAVNRWPCQPLAGCHLLCWSDGQYLSNLITTHLAHVSSQLFQTTLHETFSSYKLSVEMKEVTQSNHNVRSIKHSPDSRMERQTGKTYFAAQAYPLLLKFSCSIVNFL